jgi:hypothetical protein
VPLLPWRYYVKEVFLNVFVINEVVSFSASISTAKFLLTQLSRIRGGAGLIDLIAGATHVRLCLPMLLLPILFPTSSLLFSSSTPGFSGFSYANRVPSDWPWGLAALRNRVSDYRHPGKQAAGGFSPCDTFSASARQDP